MGSFLAKAWSLATKSRYTRHLESELERLRAELRLWQDAALVREGLPKLTPREDKQLPQVKGRMLPSIWRARLEALHPEKEKYGQEKARA